jgi:hypothetical protein
MLARLIERHGGFALPFALAVLTLAVFAPALGTGFVNWDDQTALLDNPSYRGLGWSQIRWMLTTFLLGHYSPLAWLSFGLDYLFWGLEPTGYHLTSALLHAANTVLFYLVAQRLLRGTGGAGADPGIRLCAGVAAALFAIHPLRVESVVWVSARRDVLSGVFFLPAVLAYLRAVEAPDRSRRLRWHAVSLAAFAAALLSKATVVPLPAVLLLLDVYPLRRPRAVGWRRLLPEKAPYLALAGAATVLGAIARAYGHRVLGGHGFGTQVALAGYGLVFQPWAFLWPLRLSPLYEWLGPADPRAWRFLVPLAAFAMVTAALVALRRRWPAALAAWVYSALMLLPVSSLVMHMGPYLAADRYSYLSGLGWALLVAGWLRDWTLGGRWPARISHRAAVATSLVAMV